MTTHKQLAINLAKKQRLIRAIDARNIGVPRVTLSRLVKAGELIRVGRGLYSLPDLKATEHHSMAEVIIKYPKCVVCLLSALRLHELTTQSPFEVWLAIPNKGRRPKVDYPPLRIVRFSGEALTEGVEEISVSGVMVPVTNIPRTVADCFKFRNKIGLDVALEALREAWTKEQANMDELWYYAKVCRVANVMRPYLESLT